MEEIIKGFILDRFKYDRDTGKLFYKKKVPYKNIGDEVRTLAKGYVGVRFSGKWCWIHHIVWFLEYGYWPKYLDHINQKREDNRIENLREATHTQNMMNVGKRKTNKTGYKGVFRHYKNDSWIAQICINKINTHRGCFKTPENAARTYDMAALQEFGDFAFRNFP